MDALKIITEGQMKQDAPVIRVGDTVKVHVKIREGERERIQVFEGTIIAKKGSGVSETFTVRRAFLWRWRGACFPSAFSQCCKSGTGSLR